MIQKLQLFNIFLFDKAILDFNTGFHVLTGETGAGKTIVLSSLGLLLGGKSDSHFIRTGKNFGFAEAIFDISENNSAKDILKKAEIVLDNENELTIRREIYQAKQSRSFINDQIVPVSLIKDIGKTLIEIVSQNSHQDLLSSSYQCGLLDKFGDLEKDVMAFSALWTKEKELKTEWENLLKAQEQKDKFLETLKKQLEEIQTVNLQEGELESLGHEHKKLASIHELQSNIKNIYQAIHGDSSLLYLLQEQKNVLSSLITIDEALKENEQLLQNICMELEEFVYNLRSYLGSLEEDPLRFSYIENRISEIHSLQKEFGFTYEKIKEKQNYLIDEIAKLEDLDIKTEKLQKEINDIEHLTTNAASLLHEKRKLAAEKMQKLAIEELHSLNMEHASFRIEIQNSQRTHLGEDFVQFLFSANIEKVFLPLNKGASGGELSRIMLALKKILSDKMSAPTLVFDEIDANIGGTTASIIGQKLKKLGAFLQIFCISHFVQVAHHADHHYYIHKDILDKATTTFIKKLQDKEKQKEYQRMVGIDHSSFNENDCINCK